MNMELMMQYITYGLIALGVLSFLVAVIVQVIKELPWVNRIPTSVVALVVSVILCQLAVIIVCQCCKIVIVWYYPVGAVIAAFIVYLVATGGWERVKEIWNRTKYKSK
ncbi:ribonuclease [Lachnospiraceae bacterium 38-10]